MVVVNRSEKALPWALLYTTSAPPGGCPTPALGMTAIPARKQNAYNATGGGEFEALRITRQ
jgi:hypothetical protein